MFVWNPDNPPCEMNLVCNKCSNRTECVKHYVTSLDDTEALINVIKEVANDQKSKQLDVPMLRKRLSHFLFKKSLSLSLQQQPVMTE